MEDMRNSLRNRLSVRGIGLPGLTRNTPDKPQGKAPEKSPEKSSDMSEERSPEKSDSMSVVSDDEDDDDFPTQNIGVFGPATIGLTDGLRFSPPPIPTFERFSHVDFFEEGRNDRFVPPILAVESVLPPETPPPEFELPLSPPFPPPIRSGQTPTESISGCLTIATKGSAEFGYVEQRKGARPAVGGHERDKLIESHLQKPKLSIKTGRLALLWVNSLRVWPCDLDLDNVAQHLHNGLLLCRMMERISPETAVFKQLNLKPLTRKAAIANVEQALSVICRGEKVNLRRVPSASDIYEAKSSKQVTTLLLHIFEVFVMNKVKARLRTTIKWWASVLKPYGIKLDPLGFRPPHKELWAQFRTGTALFCALHYFCGEGPVQAAAGVFRDDDRSKEGGKKGTTTEAEASATVTATSAALPTIDPRRLYFEPTDPLQVHANVSYVLKLLPCVGVPTFWDVDDLGAHHCPDFLLAQLDAVYMRFHEIPCALPSHLLDSVMGIAVAGGGEAAAALGGGGSDGGDRDHHDGRRHHHHHLTTVTYAAPSSLSSSSSSSSLRGVLQFRSPTDPPPALSSNTENGVVNSSAGVSAKGKGSVGTSFVGEKATMTTSSPHGNSTSLSPPSSLLHLSLSESSQGTTGSSSSSSKEPADLWPHLPSLPPAEESEWQELFTLIEMERELDEVTFQRASLALDKRRSQLNHVAGSLDQAQFQWADEQWNKDMRDLDDRKTHARLQYRQKKQIAQGDYRMARRAVTVTLTAPSTLTLQPSNPQHSPSNLTPLHLILTLTLTLKPQASPSSLTLNLTLTLTLTL
jgi:hypothetical protein